MSQLFGHYFFKLFAGSRRPSVRSRRSSRRMERSRCSGRIVFFSRVKGDFLPKEQVIGWIRKGGTNRSIMLVGWIMSIDYDWFLKQPFKENKYPLVNSHGNETWAFGWNLAS